MSFHDLLPPQAGMLDEVLAGLAKPQKEIPPKFFYDARGCELFELICRLPEYYPTRTELAIMHAHAREMALALGPGCLLIEIGCGNSEKTWLLLEQLRPVAFMPVDIAAEQLESSCLELARGFPGLTIAAVRADFSRPFVPPAVDAAGIERRALYFPGSTIGNFTPEEALAFLEWWAPALGPGGALLIGVDLKKDRALLDAAYNDTQGVTAEFNLNPLQRFNRELDANFDLAGFCHHAFYSPEHGRIEMHLVSVKAQRATVAGHSFEFREGETIHTENSYKYSVAEFQALAQRAGYVARHCWTDSAQMFAVHCLSLPG